MQFAAPLPWWLAFLAAAAVAAVAWYSYRRTPVALSGADYRTKLVEGREVMGAALKAAKLPRAN